MRIIRSLEAVPTLSRKTALAIGNFDGLHLGHQKILRCLMKKAREERLVSCLLTFSPHPEKIFGPEKISMIQTLEQRLEGLRGFGLDLVCVAPFSREFAGLSSEDFVQKILVKKLRIRTAVVGPNFRFGKGRRGDIPALRKFGRRFGFDVLVVPPVRKKTLVVSSSLIRELLRLGHIGSANQLLGRPYEIEGDVVRGKARGRRLDFPTANIEAANEIIPRGVFVTLLELEGKSLPSLTNIGFRPTFKEKRLTFETHVLGLRQTIYGASVKIRFIKKIREERVFGTVEELAARIRKDADIAGRYLEKYGKKPQSRA